MDEEILKLFFKKKTTEIFLAVGGDQIRNGYTLQISKKMEGMGLLKSRRGWRRVSYSLTPEGEEVREQLLKILG